MPGPFPGMNPYLEAPDLWPSFHNSLIFCLGEALNAVLPDDFVARTEQRCYIAWEDREIIPDVIVLEERNAELTAPSQGGTAIAVPTIESVPEVLKLASWEVHEHYLEIRRVRGNKRVVTAIEILSPTNKRPGEGREQYLKKQREVLASDVNLLEMDLLRTGAHTVAAPREIILRRFGDWNYLITLSRSRDRSLFEIWRNHLSERLPVVLIPLTEGLPDVILDLQTAFNHAFDAGRYSYEMNYQTEPEPPLQAAEAAWTDALLREKSLRVG
ncbi:MAG TPA: DUF4058 family protein [Chthonomonadaceae bacterium]|nr:DUF4058 family protein [Chthonomonadaceae bacterium]